LEKGKPAYRSRGFANVLTHTRALTNREHPHKKPVEILLPLIEHTTAPNDLVVDPFAGSGSTGVAAVRLGRDFIGIECAYKYVQVARARLAGAEPDAGSAEILRKAA
jgi:site-specific DNA-methyltransferase (adenine-specific)